MQAPRHLHLVVVCRIVRYLQGTSTQARSKIGYLSPPLSLSTALCSLHVLKLFGFGNCWVNLGFLKLSLLHSIRTILVLFKLLITQYFMSAPLKSIVTIREAYDAHVISLLHITTDLQTDDVFTKALSQH
ncbi:unnamed protein product, partial [Musa banksii]